MFGAPPQNPKNMFSLVQFKHPHPRYPKTLLLPYGVKWYWCLGRHPRTQTTFLALCNSNTPIPRIQKHLCCPMEYSGIGVWGATPEPKQYFYLCAIQTSPSQVSKSTFAALCSTVVLVFGAPPQNPNTIFSLVQFKHSHPRYPKTSLLPYGVK